MSLEHKPPYTPDDQYRAERSIHSAPGGGRDFATYCNIFDLHPENLEGKRILDLGAGSELKFAQGLKERGVDAEVVSFSPAFIDEYNRKTLGFMVPSAEVKKSVVAGMGEQLPFKDASFDLILSVHVADYIHDDDNVKRFLEEIARVLAPHGMAYIYPISPIKGLLTREGATLFNGRAQFIASAPGDKGGGIRIKKA